MWEEVVLSSTVRQRGAVIPKILKMGSHCLLFVGQSKEHYNCKKRESLTVGQTLSTARSYMCRHIMWLTYRWLGRKTPMFTVKSMCSFKTVKDIATLFFNSKENASTDLPYTFKYLGCPFLVPYEHCHLPLSCSRLTSLILSTVCFAEIFWLIWCRGSSL